MWGYGGRGFPTAFEAQYNCSSTAMAGKDVDEGDKIFLPPSALDKLARMNVEYPMLFEVSSESVGKKSHCGVLEFSAEEGWCYMPFWMMQNLLVDEGSLVTVKNVSLSKASFVKFRAQSVDFIEVSNPRALLEVALRKFTCLTVGDVICIPYGKTKKFYLDVREVQPNNAASIIETDCNVDFEEPLGYQDSKYAQYERDKKAELEAAALGGNGSSGGAAVRNVQRARADTEEEAALAAAKFSAFSGNAKRIDGKATSTGASSNSESTASSSSGFKSTSAAESKASIGIASSNSDSKGFSGTAAEGKSPDAPPAAPIPYKSRIGDKYSKKKNAVSAFTGTAHKLNP